MQLVLLRHGTTGLSGTYRGSLDDALNAQGWQQMQAATAALSDIQQVISSPLQRCRIFAEQYAAQQQLPIEQLVGLQELHFGDWEGLSAVQLMQTDADALRAFWENPLTFTPPNAESFQAFMQRVEHSLAYLQAQYSGKKLLVVTHGGVIRHLLVKARKLAIADFLQIEVPHGGMYWIDYADSATGDEILHV